MIERFFTYAAGPFLMTYLVLLLSSSYISQQNLRQASTNSLISNLEKRASVLSYFHSERKNDMRTLAFDHALRDFFVHRNSKTSIEPKQQKNSILIQNTFQEVIDSKRLNNDPIYQRLLFVDPENNIIVDIGESCISPIHWHKLKIPEINKMRFFLFQDHEHTHSILISPYFHDNIRVGSIIAEINHEQVLHFLIRSQSNENTSYTIFIADQKYILHNKDRSREGSFPDLILLKNGPESPVDKASSFIHIPVSGTPFILAAQYNSDSPVNFLATRWYLLSLFVLALLVLYSVAIRVRSRTHTLLLEARLEEADRQRSLLDKKNKLLKSEIKKRLNSEKRLQTLLETIPDLIWLKDPAGAYLSCNHKFERFSGRSEKDIIGRTDYDFLSKELADNFRKKDQVAMNSSELFVSEEIFTFADDHHKELLEVIRTPLCDSAGNLVGVLGIARDITARKQAEEESRYFSIHDPLTGLYNRRVLEERITEELNRAKRYRHQLSVFMVDLDHFKMVNDTYGHQNGDIALCHLAELLERSIRKTDYVARYGGEEFIVVLPETSLTEALDLAERLCKEIKKHKIPITDKKSTHITASIGVACFPEHHHCWQGLIEVADSAMYAAKRAGRNQVKAAPAGTTDESPEQ